MKTSFKDSDIHNNTKSINSNSIIGIVLFVLILIYLGGVTILFCFREGKHNFSEQQEIMESENIAAAQYQVKDPI